ncbi:hypothetical protein Mapa_004917 [Marchantia paleacea]|nr:hypothetical protein Mapa_004917 [Marchantia paleacea]
MYRPEDPTELDRLSAMLNDWLEPTDLLLPLLSKNAAPMPIPPPLPFMPAPAMVDGWKRADSLAAPILSVTSMPRAALRNEVEFLESARFSALSSPARSSPTFSSLLANPASIRSTSSLRRLSVSRRSAFSLESSSKMDPLGGAGGPSWMVMASPSLTFPRESTLTQFANPSGRALPSLPSAGTRLQRHRGQVACEKNHMSMHSGWKRWPHFGSNLSRSSSSNSLRHTAHSDKSLPPLSPLTRE